MNDQPLVGDDQTVDTTKPNVARVYDHLLGGGHNFPADREHSARLTEAVPDARHAAVVNRAFLRRAVIHMSEQGVRQFLDLGSGIPTVGNVHEIAHKFAPGSAVVYVDSDAVATAHSRILLGGVPAAAAVHADLRYVDGVLSHPTVRDLLDFEQPIGLLMCAVLHFVSEQDDPARIVRSYVDALCLGSYVGISHATADGRPVDVAAAVQLYQRRDIRFAPRSHAAVANLFSGLDLVPPGVVPTSHWRPDWRDLDEPGRSMSYAGLAMKSSESVGMDWPRVDADNPRERPAPERTAGADGPIGTQDV
jgi:hypothetical protein